MGQAIGPKPDYDDYDDVSQWVDDLKTWDDLWPTDRAAKHADDIVHSCGDPGHDYSDHIVEYKGQAILDTNLSEGEKARPLTGPSWTEVDPEIWSDDYRGSERKKWDFDKTVFDVLLRSAAQGGWTGLPERWVTGGSRPWWTLGE